MFKERDTETIVRPIGGQVPPNDLDAEIRVLSSVFEDATVLDSVCAIAPPESWYSHANKTILIAMQKIQESGDTPSLAAVRGWLADNDKLAKVGGNEYLAMITTQVPYVLEPEREAYRIEDKAKLRRTIATCYEFAARAYTEEGIEGQALLDQLESRVFDLAEQKTMSGFKTAIEVAKETGFEMQRGIDGADPSFSTGLTDLDTMIGGMFPSDVTVVAGRPGMGKTSVALQLAIAPTLAKNGSHASGLVELEMKASQLMHRVVGCSSGIPYRKIRKPKLLNEEEIRKLMVAFAETSKLHFEIDDDAEASAESIRAAVRRLQAKHRKEGRKLAVVVIDYLQLMSTATEKGKTREREVAEVMRAVKLMAKSLDVHMVVVAQLNREVEGTKSKRPQMKDLRESGSIEQDADNVLLLYRDDYYKASENPDQPAKWDNKLEIIVAKQRSGPTGVIQVHYDASISKFMDIEHHRKELDQ